jgi:hypothetical protein
LGTINEFWNASKKSTLMICDNEVFAAKGLVTEVPGNNVANSEKSHQSGERRCDIVLDAHRRIPVMVRIGPDNA